MNVMVGRYLGRMTAFRKGHGILLPDFGETP
jgi:hypothetical protein